jgi:hypothetical protein
METSPQSPFFFCFPTVLYGMIDFAFASKILIHTSPLVNSEQLWGDTPFGKDLVLVFLFGGLFFGLFGLRILGFAGFLRAVD